ncbi:hypothetical protein BO221_07265 [Archangium sp. Cb G35]|uniref:YncE family protein n=1 Tax=Archangium sp. Cb G35 TaxID=1920190 RepID=UPI0009359BD7|nr:PKD domain-containing protein [Archangium sp. Cb G35]OJT25651.1 hypothetical protein BO221_07265 [Archangium sp. Cb G35]
MSLRLHCLLAASTLLCACQLSGPPVARISFSPSLSNATHRWPVVLDGSQSSDPEGAALTFAWSFISRPSGSHAVLLEPASARPSFKADQKGDYKVQLVVSDGLSWSEPATAIVRIENQRPQADSDMGLEAGVVGTPFTFSGHGWDWDSGPINDSLTYSWTLTQRPPGSTAVLTGADTATPSLTPDVEGEYRLAFVVGDGLETSPSVTVTLAAHRPIQLLGHRVADAGYSKALDRLVMVSEFPNALYVYDPATRTETAVALPKAPLSVSIGPDGRFAAVGHEALVSYVDLATPRLLKTLPVSANSFELVLAGNGYAYAFPGGGQGEQPARIHSIHLATGTVTLNDGPSIVAGNRVRLHPGGTALYAAERWTDPNGLEKYDISGGTAQVLYDSPSATESPPCGDLWFSEEGDRIFTRCGNTFRASSIRSEDMRYVGVLPSAGNIRHLSHSTAAGRIALVLDPEDPNVPPMPVQTQVHLFRPDLTFDRSVPLPPFVRRGRAYAGLGRFVFFTSAGDKLVVLLQAPLESAMLNDYGIITY